MRKGHRRTQSAFTTASTEPVFNPQVQTVKANEVFKLLQASENKVHAKVVHYEKLEIGNLQENSYLKFGNFTIQKRNNCNQKDPQAKQKLGNGDLNCIPENSKSSDISSKRQSKEGGVRDQDFLPIPVRKVKPKRISDFQPIYEERKQKSTSQISTQNKLKKQAKSLKKK